MDKIQKMKVRFVKQNLSILEHYTEEQQLSEIGVCITTLENIQDGIRARVQASKNQLDIVTESLKSTNELPEKNEKAKN